MAEINWHVLESVRLQLECQSCAVRIADVGHNERVKHDCTDGPHCKFRESFERKMFGAKQSTR